MQVLHESCVSASARIGDGREALGERSFGRRGPRVAGGHGPLGDRAARGAWAAGGHGPPGDMGRRGTSAAGGHRPPGDMGRRGTWAVGGHGPFGPGSRRRFRASGANRRGWSRKRKIRPVSRPPSGPGAPVAPPHVRFLDRPPDPGRGCPCSWAPTSGPGAFRGSRYHGTCLAGVLARSRVDAVPSRHVRRWRDLQGSDGGETFRVPTVARPLGLQQPT
jgi:hypothetical protein